MLADFYEKIYNAHIECHTQYASKFRKLSSGHRTRKGQFSFQSKKKVMPKNVQTTTQLHSSHTLAQQCLKFSKPGFNSKWILNLQMFKLDLEKAEDQRSNCQHLLDHRKSKRVPEKHLCQSLWLWITTNCGKFFKRWEHQTTLPASWEICMQVKKQQSEPDMGQ